MVATGIHALTASLDASKAKWYGSASAPPDGWIAYWNQCADEAREEHPEINVREIKLDGF